MNNEQATALSLDRTAQILDSVTPNPRLDEYACENGIVLKLKKIREVLITDAANKIEVPKVPRWYNAEKGRDEDNPNDPTYQTLMQQASYNQGMVAIAVCLSMGTEVKVLPDDIAGPDTSEWVEDVAETTGMEVPRSARGRYLAWLKYYALSSTDLLGVVSAVQRFSGSTLQADVEAAQDSFRNNQTRQPNNEVPTQ